MAEGGIDAAAANPFRYRGYYFDGESGLYYLNSRYYNPTWGRFINGDAYVSTGQGILGYNMYSYCNNNPVMGYDPGGERTYSWGGTASAGCGVGISVSWGWTVDEKGNIALQFSYATGISGTGVSLAAFFGGTKEDEISTDSNSTTIYAGGSVSGEVVSIGGDVIYSNPNGSSEATEAIGGQVTVGTGIGSPVDVHVYETTTYTPVHFNIMDDVVQPIVDTAGTVWNGISEGAKSLWSWLTSGKES